MIQLEDLAHSRPGRAMGSQKTNLREDMLEMGILREGWVVWGGKGCGGKKNGISTGAADFGRVSTSTTVQANVIVRKE